MVKPSRSTEEIETIALGKEHIIADLNYQKMFEHSKKFGTEFPAWRYYQNRSKRRFKYKSYCRIIV